MEDRDYMLAALELAKEASADGEVPVGCIITRNGEIVGRGRNRREKGKNALCHAELEAINDACTRLGGWRLWECTLYVTLEPCPMCAGAIINARIPRVVYGAKDQKAVTRLMRSSLESAQSALSSRREQPFTRTELAALFAAMLTDA